MCRCLLDMIRPRRVYSLLLERITTCDIVHQGVQGTITALGQAVRIISLKLLKDFWENPISPEKAESNLRSWYKTVEAAAWQNFGELRADFRSTDKVGHCYVFDVMNNHIRLIAFVFFADEKRSGIVYIRKVMTHAEYDENKWPDQCGCYTLPKLKAKKSRRPRKQPRRKTK